MALRRDADDAKKNAMCASKKNGKQVQKKGDLPSILPILLHAPSTSFPLSCILYHQLCPQTREDVDYRISFLHIFDNAIFV